MVTSTILIYITTNLKYRISMVNAVDEHPQTDEIVAHLAAMDMTVKQISETYGVTTDALNWYKRHHLKPKLDEVKEEFKEEHAQELRVLFHKYRDILDAALAQASDDIIAGRIKANTIKDIINLVDLVTKITGEQVFHVEMKHTWGDKLAGNPRIDAKGRVYKLEDLANMENEVNMEEMK